MKSKLKPKHFWFFLEICFLIIITLIMLIILVPEIINAKTNSNTITMNTNETYQIQVDYDTQIDCSEEAKEKAEEKLDIEWTSSNGSVALVDNSGIITAVGQGTATITMKTQDNTGENISCTTKVVVKVPVQKITIENELGQSCTSTIAVLNKYVVSVTSEEIADMARIVQLETNGACYYTHYLTACVMVNRLLDWNYSSMTEVIYAKNQYSTAYMTTSYISDDVWDAVYEALTDPDRNVHYQDSCSSNNGKTVYWQDPTTGEKIYY